MSTADDSLPRENANQEGIRKFAFALSEWMIHLDRIDVSTNQSKFRAEFECVVEEERENLRMSERFLAATTDENIHLNRYSNIFANDATRVRLHFAENASQLTQSDYINANIIPPALTEPHDVHPYYIATQAPLHNTFEHFWHMVCQESVPLIVVLSRESEDGYSMPRYDQYWPRIGEQIAFGSYGVKNVAESFKNENIISRTLVVSKPKAASDPVACQEHRVEQLQFVAWPDHDVPSSPKDVLELIRFCDVIASENPGKPVIVHCSAGVGRTGTFIAIDLMVRRLREAYPTGITSVKNSNSATSHANGGAPGSVSEMRCKCHGKIVTDCAETTFTSCRPIRVEDIRDTVRALKRSRSQMVQTFQQYRFIYLTLLTAADEMMSLLAE